MGDCATQKMRFETTPLALEAAFDGGKLTSDGGLIWLAEADEELGNLCEAIAEHLPEWRRRKGRHRLITLVKQRVFSRDSVRLKEDQSDSDSLRTDALLKLVCAHLPEAGAALAKLKPTISRMENARPPAAPATR